MNLATGLCQKRHIFGNEDLGFRGREGKVLYLSLEDGKRRFQQRMKEIDADPDLDKLERNLAVYFQWEKLNKGGLEAIAHWIEKTKNPRLVIVDTLAKVWSKSSKTGGGGLYSEEYAIYSPLADLAHKHNISIVLVTHTTKGRTADVFDAILGGMGTQGPCDNLIVLANDPDGRKRLSIRGKDIEERHLAFETPGGPSHWTFLGKAEELQKSAERQEIIDVLKSHNEPLARAEIKEELQQRESRISPKSVPAILRRMVAEGQLEQPESYGPYQLAGYASQRSDEEIAEAMKRKRP